MTETCPNSGKKDIFPSLIKDYQIICGHVLKPPKFGLCPQTIYFYLFLPHAKYFHSFPGSYKGLISLYIIKLRLTVYNLNLIQAQVQRSLLRMTAFDAQTRYLSLKEPNTQWWEKIKKILSLNQKSQAYQDNCVKCEAMQLFPLYANSNN